MPQAVDGTLRKFALRVPEVIYQCSGIMVFGKRIKSLSLGDDDALHFEMVDGSKFKFYDDGQSCCESRYMRTDDTLSDFVGATFTGAEVKDAPSVKDDDYGEHEVQFLEIQTDRGVFTMASHNEHNGYYGGFLIRADSE